MGHGIQVRSLGVKKSIKARLIVTFVGITVIAFSMIMLANHFLLEKYYVTKKIDSIKVVYEELNHYEKLTDKKLQDLKSLCIEKNISWLIMDTYHSEILYYDSRNPNRLYASLFGYITGIESMKTSILEREETYTLEIKRDMELDYLDMWHLCLQLYQMLLNLQLLLVSCLCLFPLHRIFQVQIHIYKNYILAFHF